MEYEIKHSGQVFTPDYLVNLILDEAGYYGIGILNKHCIDNSCGDGAFLCEIVSRYINAYIEAYGSATGLSNEICEYIHGIELDHAAYSICLSNLRDVCKKFGVECEDFDIHNKDTLQVTEFDGKMDFVVGNPPYVRVHNLNASYDNVKTFSFANGGMTDLYLVFFEKGFKMLGENGKLCYITPSSWLNSVAGGAMRDYIRQNRNLLSVIDLEHYQAFKATTYTLISLFEKGRRNKTFKYNVFNPQTLNKTAVEELAFDEIDINDCFYLSTHQTLLELRNILSTKTPRYVTVKNGFATLADKVFISDSFPFEDFTIPTIKASTGKWYKAFFPYDSSGKPLPREIIFSNSQISQYLEANKSELLKGKTEATNPQWYLFGRTQALKDVFTNKLSVNTTIKDINSVKINSVESGSGIYSGLYILSYIDFGIIKKVLLSERFIYYVKSLKKYKSGGYYTYNSKDLEFFLNYELDILNGENAIKFSKDEQHGLFARNQQVI